MQRVSHSLYTYDASGKLTGYVPSGGTADVVAKHALLDDRLQGPRHLIAGGIRPTVLNTNRLFVPAMSTSSPPVTRPRTLMSEIGYTDTTDVNHEASDLFTLTNAIPYIQPSSYNNVLSTQSNVVFHDTMKNRT